MKTFTPAEVIALVRAAITRSGLDQKAFAAKREISPSYLSDILQGYRRAPDRLLAHLGLERVTITRKKGKSK